MEPDIDNLIPVVEEARDILTRKVFARDPQGNIWSTMDFGSGPTTWRLERRVEDTPRVTPSLQQIVDAAKKAASSEPAS